MAMEARLAPRAAVVALASGLLLAGCGRVLAPYVQTVRDAEAEAGAAATGALIEVCYNRATTTPQAVAKLADDVCVKQGRHAAFLNHRYLNCSLLQPVSANFACR